MERLEKGKQKENGKKWQTETGRSEETETERQRRKVYRPCVASSIHYSTCSVGTFVYSVKWN